ncbi:hypothetical protein EDC04DRAFT_2887873 [Pisolithus marmoratus]|nr:hypothetical protein EDC04DRAFT_2887873 [Pisolithus marmoratus]
MKELQCVLGKKITTVPWTCQLDQPAQDAPVTGERFWGRNGEEAIFEKQAWRLSPLERSQALPNFNTSALTPATMSVHPFQISYAELQGTEDSIESIEVVYDGHRHTIPRQGPCRFREDFSHPLMVRGESISFSVVRRRQLHIGPKQASEVIKINVQDIISKLPTQKFQTVCNRLDITLGLSPSSVSSNAGSGRNANPLHPITGELLDECPRFRILVIGQPGVGKSTLINRAFGIGQASVESFEPGTANIEKEFISPQNDRFILHAGDINCDNVKSFVEKRKKQKHVTDQLHAVWLCFRIPIPSHGDRFLDECAETFLKVDASVLHNIALVPTIVVFTKYDKLLNHMAMKAEVDPDAAAAEYLQEHCIDPIVQLVGGTDLSYLTVSSNPGHERGRNQLLVLTHEKVAAAFVSQLGKPSPVSVVTQMAQRVSPSLKIEGTITVGKHRYWRVPTDYPVLEYLAAIHTDAVCVWNFHDPSQHLFSDDFREIMASLVWSIDVSTPAFPTNAMGE